MAEPAVWLVAGGGKRVGGPDPGWGGGKPAGAPGGPAGGGRGRGGMGLGESIWLPARWGGWRRRRPAKLRRGSGRERLGRSGWHGRSVGAHIHRDEPLLIRKRGTPRWGGP